MFPSHQDSQHQIHWNDRKKAALGRVSQHQPYIPHCANIFEHFGKNTDNYDNITGNDRGFNLYASFIILTWPVFLNVAVWDMQSGPGGRPCSKLSSHRCTDTSKPPSLHGGRQLKPLAGVLNRASAKQVSKTIEFGSLHKMSWKIMNFLAMREARHLTQEEAIEWRVKWSDLSLACCLYPRPCLCVCASMFAWISIGRVFPYFQINHLLELIGQRSGSTKSRDVIW